MTQDNIKYSSSLFYRDNMARKGTAWLLILYMMIKKIVELGNMILKITNRDNLRLSLAIIITDRDKVVLSLEYINKNYR